MTSDLRQRLVVLLVGMAAALIGLTVRARLLAGGTSSDAKATTLGVLAGIAVAVVLWRTFTFFAGRRR
jgi:hypothetical protein